MVSEQTCRVSREYSSIVGEYRFMNSPFKTPEQLADSILPHSEALKNQKTSRRWQEIRDYSILIVGSEDFKNGRGYAFFDVCWGVDINKRGIVLRNTTMDKEYLENAIKAAIKKELHDIDLDDVVNF